MENIFDIILIPIGYLIKLCYLLLPNYAAALLLFAIIIKLLLFPLGIKQQKNMIKQAKLKPKEMAIRKRYAGRTDKPTQQKMNEDLMKLYQEEKFNPMGGCLPMIPQFVILYAIYAVITNPLKYICNFTTEMITGIKNTITALSEAGTLITNGLSQNIIDKIGKGTRLSGIELTNVLRVNGLEKFSEYIPADFAADKIPSFKIGSFDLSLTPSFEINWMLLVPVITFLVVFFSMRFTRKMTYQAPSTQDAAASMKFMDFTMPLISVWITFTVPAIVGVYWIYQNILSALQQFILKLMYPIPEFSDEDYKKAETEMNAGIKRISNKAKKKASKIPSHRIDLETEQEEENNEAEPETDKEMPSSTADIKQNKKLPPAPLKDDDKKNK